MLFSLKTSKTSSFCVLAAAFALAGLPASANPTAKPAKKLHRAGKKTAAKVAKIAAKPRRVFVMFGPPLPHDRARAAWQAETLRGYCKAGKLRFANPERDGEQLFCVARDGLYIWPPETPQAVASSAYVPASDAPRPPLLASRNGNANRSASAAAPYPPETKTPETPLPNPPDVHLLEALRVLAVHSASSRPLEILSLFRPPYRTAYWRHGGPGTLHSHGMAVDIAAYGGHKIALTNPEACVQMTLALLRDLPPGNYRMGLPKAPDTPLIPGRLFLPPSLYALVYGEADAGRARQPLSSRRGKAKRRQTPAAAPETSSDSGHFAVVAVALGMAAGEESPAWPFFPAPQPEIKDGVIAAAKAGGSQVRIVRFQNEAYAPAESLADVRLRDALKAAAKRGVKIIGMFPDGADHIHLDVKPRR